MADWRHLAGGKKEAIFTLLCSKFTVRFTETIFKNFKLVKNYCKKCESGEISKPVEKNVSTNR